MRLVFLDVETTGLDVKNGHRIIEIACVEMLDRQITDTQFHVYINPEREIDEGAFATHQISLEFLADKPLFQEVAESLIEFIRDAELVIHNKAFDVSFLDSELTSCGHSLVTHYCPVITDTLQMARAKDPGKKATLDALCDRYSIDRSGRQAHGHGALIDSLLLAEVFLALTRGQESLFIPDPVAYKKSQAIEALGAAHLPKIINASAEEVVCHEALLDRIAATLIDKEDPKNSKPVVWRMADAASAVDTALSSKAVP